MERQVEELRARDSDIERRLEGVASTLLELRHEVACAERLLNGGGEQGLLARVRAHEERIERLRRQGRWVLALVSVVMVVVVSVWWLGS